MRVRPDPLPLATLVALFVGYACSYCHRADLAAVAPLWALDGAHGPLRAALPDIASLGMFVYAVGKLLGGVLAERFGGRTVFVGALVGAGLAQCGSALADDPVPFAVCRVLGMVVLGCAWPALGTVVAAVTPRHRLATVMAFVSQSYLVGDAAVRAVFAAVVARGGDAHAVFATGATGLLVGAAVVALVLAVAARQPRPTPPAEAFAGLVRADASPPAHSPDGALVRLLAALAAMNFGLAMVREALSLWLPSLLVELAGRSADDALRASAVLPLASGLGALVAGPLADRGPRTLLWVTALPSVLGGLALAVLAGLAAAGAVPFVALLGLCVFASAGLAMPMTLASGVLPLRLAATGGARRLGFVDGAGSFGAVLAGGLLARVQAGSGAAGLFVVLACVAAASAAMAVVVHAVSAGRTAAGPPRR